MQWFAKAPSNIALIKYMGKKDSLTNVPNNPSLSYTLNHLVSSVRLETYDGEIDCWKPLSGTFNLSPAAQMRYLKHLAYLKAHYQYSGAFIVYSDNNFPHGNGLASSASSFAALTQCAVLALSELTNTPMISIEEQANLARQGSGSACRSLFSPWAYWDENGVKSIDIDYHSFIHQVVMISSAEKEVSSSEAHKRIHTSHLYAARAEQATNHLNALLTAFKTKDWFRAYQICWQEFNDMHQLFATSTPPFAYITDKSRQLLQRIQTDWENNGDGPLVTMDAGPNIHLLYRMDQEAMANQIKRDLLISSYHVV